MRLTEFVEAVAHTIDRSDRIVLADDDRDDDPRNDAVYIAWGVGQYKPDTILVRTSDGDTFQLDVKRIGGEPA